jgi:hypothetical protein
MIIRDYKHCWKPIAPTQKTLFELSDAALDELLGVPLGIEVGALQVVDPVDVFEVGQAWSLLV